MIILAAIALWAYSSRQKFDSVAQDNPEHRPADGPSDRPTKSTSAATEFETNKATENEPDRGQDSRPTNVPKIHRATNGPDQADPPIDSSQDSHAEDTLATGANPAIEKSAPPPSRGLTGLSSDYSDFHCRRIQSAHGIRIPRAAEIIEVNGFRLPMTNIDGLQESPSPVLFLPPGRHAVRFRTSEPPMQITIENDFTAAYAEARRFFDIAGRIRVEDLIDRGGRTMDVHGASLLLNFHGADYAAKNQWQAAERKFRRALRVNPMFSPAHLNLAYTLMQQERRDEAAIELELADLFNIGNVFGLTAAITDFRRQFSIDRPDTADTAPIQFVAGDYVSSEPLTVEDERITSVMQAISKYAVRGEDRGKILNNLAIHFAESGRTELALEHFRNALAALKTAGPERFELANRILGTMSDVCRQAGFEEADEYAAMRQYVLP